MFDLRPNRRFVAVASKYVPISAGSRTMAPELTSMLEIEKLCSALSNLTKQGVGKRLLTSGRGEVQFSRAIC